MQANKQFCTLLGMLLTLVSSNIGAADGNLSLEPEKVQRIMQRSKLLEGQIQVRQKNAQQRNDPTAKQYNIGYSDGYNKAVLDLLKSQLLNGVGSGNTGSINSGSPRSVQQPLRASIQGRTAPVQRAAVVQTVARKPLEETHAISNSSSEKTSSELSISPPVVIPLAVVTPKAVSMVAPKFAPNRKKVPLANNAKSIVKATPKVVVPRKNFTDFLLLSTRSLEAKNWSQAVSYASAALSLKPSSGQALINRSWAYAEQGLLHKALIDANESIRLLPTNALAYNNRAYTYDLLADLPRARKDYQKACELHFNNACAIVVKIDQLTANRPQKIAALMAQSQIKVSQKSWRGLEDLSNQIIMLDTNNTEALVHRSWAYAEQGQLDKALTDADRAVLLSPDNAFAYNNRAYTYELRNDLPRATQDYKRSCELNYQPACMVVEKIKQLSVTKMVTTKPRGATEIDRLINKSLHMFREGNWHAVEQLSNKIISLDPKNALAYVNRAGARTEMGLMYNALDDINVALKLDPTLGIAHNNKAYALERIGKIPRAAKSYKRACDLGVQQSCQDFRRINIRTTSSRDR